jgi:hypothetical protein
VTAVVFDVDETRNWEERAADECGVPRFTLMALVAAAAARGERPQKALEWLDVKPSHIRRGPWGYLHNPPPEAIRITSLDELPDALS